MTRLQFLRTVFRSWPIRLSVLVLGGLVAACVAVGLWQARRVFLFAAVAVGWIVLANALSYGLSDKRRRHRLDEESRRTRSSWAYAYRGLLWSGFGVAMGSLVAHGSSGRDPTGGLVAGLALMGLGTIAHGIWAYHRAGTKKNLLKKACFVAATPASPAVPEQNEVTQAGHTKDR